MIITRLVCGLGNQLFQYSLGRNLAIKNKTILCVDDCTSQVGNPREYELYRFKVKCLKIPKFFLQHVLVLRGTEYANRKKVFPPNVNSFLPFTYQLISEKKRVFDPKILKVGNNVYLEGFWQSEKYFIENEGKIREELEIKSQMDEYNQTVFRKIQSSNSICVHIRRGDTASGKYFNPNMGLCSIKYYEDCIRIISGKVSDPFFFFFSDEPGWVKENIKTKRPSLISNNPPQEGYKDLKLMSSCKHFIIANSTFSWWGAWLAKNPNKIVIAPRKWSIRNEVESDEIIPRSWIRV